MLDKFIGIGNNALSAQRPVLAEHAPDIYQIGNCKVFYSRVGATKDADYRKMHLSLDDTSTHNTIDLTFSVESKRLTRFKQSQGMEDFTVQDFHPETGRALETIQYKTDSYEEYHKVVFDEDGGMLEDFYSADPAGKYHPLPDPKECMTLLASFFTPEPGQPVPKRKMTPTQAVKAEIHDFLSANIGDMQIIPAPKPKETPPPLKPFKLDI